MYEVELKFPLDSPDALLAKLEAMGARRGTTLVQCDQYFNHPARDFAQTDEALRIRTDERGARITYKGPRVDHQTKTRREIELPVGANDGDDEKLSQLLKQLGFRQVRAVRKKRLPLELDWENRQLELVLDEVDGLGHFLEIETIADEQSKAAAGDSILRLAKQLGLENSERRSYLSLLLAND